MLKGHGFENIPTHALGIVSTRNTEPLINIRSTSAAEIIPIKTKTPTEITLGQESVHTHGSSTYLGAIVSQDRETIYWVNDTAPLP